MKTVSVLDQPFTLITLECLKNNKNSQSESGSLGNKRIIYPRSVSIRYTTEKMVSYFQRTGILK